MAASEERVKPWRDLLWPGQWKVVREHKAGHESTRAGVGTQGQAVKQGGGGGMRHLGASRKSWSALEFGIAAQGVEAAKGKLFHH